jgi:hypothetical protein
MRAPEWSRGWRPGLVALLGLVITLVLAVAVRPDSSTSRDELASEPSAAAPARVGQPAPSQVRTERPQVIRLPSGTSMPVDVVATGKHRVLDLPTNIDRAGWWDGGAKIGDPYGVMVLAAHVDSVTAGIGPFAELLATRPGQKIRVAGARSAQEFEIASVRLQPRASLAEDAAIFSVHGPLRLVLITCAGPFDSAAGGYRDNLIVLAEPAGAPRANGD